MKKVLILLSVLFIILPVSGCIFGGDDKADSGANALVGTWGHYGPGGTSYHTIRFYNYDSGEKTGRFTRYDYDIKDGSRTQTWTGFGRFEVDRNKSGFFEKDKILLIFLENSGEEEYRTDYIFEIKGKTLMLDGSAWARE